MLMLVKNILFYCLIFVFMKICCADESSSHLNLSFLGDIAKVSLVNPETLPEESFSTKEGDSIVECSDVAGVDLEEYNIAEREPNIPLIIALKCESLRKKTWGRGGCCPYCNGNYFRCLQSHISNVHMGPYQCTGCNKEFSTKNKRRDHAKRCLKCYSGQNFEASEKLSEDNTLSSVEVSTESSLLKKKPRQEIEKGFCDICNDFYVNISGHNDCTHKGPYVCNRGGCMGLEFSTYKRLWGHQNRIHGGVLNPRKVIGLNKK